MKKVAYIIGFMMFLFISLTIYMAWLNDLAKDEYLSTYVTQKFGQKISKEEIHQIRCNNRIFEYDIYCSFSDKNVFTQRLYSGLDFPVIIDCSSGACSVLVPRNIKDKYTLMEAKINIDKIFVNNFMQNAVFHEGVKSLNEARFARTQGWEK
jgi:hypothetical protein